MYHIYRTCCHNVTHLANCLPTDTKGPPIGLTRHATRTCNGSIHYFVDLALVQLNQVSRSIGPSSTCRKGKLSMTLEANIGSSLGYKVNLLKDLGTTSIGEVCGWHVADGIMEKWWRQHINDFKSGATRALGPELRGESLSLTRVGYTWQWRCFTSLPCWRHCSECSDWFFRVKA